MRPLSVAVAVCAAALACGCGEDQPIQEHLPPKPPAAPSSAAAAASGAGPAADVSAGRREFPEAEFTETERSRDPFRSYTNTFVQENKAQLHSQREVILSDYAVDDLKLVGIVTRIDPARAMLVDPTGKGHVVHRGDFVGRADVVQLGGQSGATYQLNWRLDRIRDGDVVLVREDPNNPDVPAATKVITLRPEAQDQKGGG
jgi:type IV pilus assembly protein PilP